MKECCPKCNRPYGKGVRKTSHHIYPRRHFGNNGNNETVYICQQCHAELEKLIADAEKVIMEECKEIFKAICDHFLGIV